MVDDNPISVLTNAPNFDWHMTNLRNHINLTNVNVDDLKLGSTTLPKLGQGTGLLGLPGDYTLASRFLRATALAYSAAPVGAVAEKVVAKDGSKTTFSYEQTQWVTVYDLKKQDRLLSHLWGLE